MATLFLLGMSALSAGLPMLCWLSIMWWMDRYEREPLWLVGLTFLWGAVGAATLALVFNMVGHLSLALAFGPQAAELAAPVVVAPLVEEPMKALVLFLVVRSREFDNMTDGFVYGAASGLGFGMTENFLYFTDVGSSGDLGAWLGTVLVRTFYSALMHGCATSCVGAALGWARGRGLGFNLLALIAGFAVAMGMHGLWNGLLSWDAAEQLNGALTVVDLLVFPVEFITIATVYQLCLWSESRLIQAELADEARLGHVPEPHVPVLASTLARGRVGWLPRGVPQSPYVRTATRLAFRKRQARLASGRELQRLAQEIHGLRAELKGLLALNP